MNKEFAWFLGYLLSDGSIVRPAYRKNGDERRLAFCIKNTDKEVLYKVKKILGTRASINEYPDYKSPQAKIEIYDRKDIIRDYNDIKQRVPSDIEGFERHFIRGVCDGDGCIYIRKNRYGTVTIQIINEVKEIIEWVYKIVEEKLGIEAKEPRHIPKDNIYEFRFEGRVARLIVWWLYHGDINHCCLDRKRQNYIDNIIGSEDNTYEKELLLATQASIIEDKVVPNVQAHITLKWCHLLQPLLKMKTTPMFHSKGQTKYYMLHIHEKQ